jgi:phosphatidylserine/phosphatidylglycerophosphate/cardiolipin synthase-like enzyme
VPIDALKTKYFVQAADASPPSEPVPETFADSKITPVIDCSNYNAELEAALATVGTGANPAANANHFIYIANWWLGLRGGRYEGVDSLFNSIGANIVESGHYTLDPPADTKPLLQLLIDKSKAGVDVRVLGWVSFAIMDSNIAQMSGAGSIARINAMTMQSIKELRAEPTLAKKAVLNVIAHTAGAVHTKMVVIGNNIDAVGFTGGLDFEMGRFARPGHLGNETWHDVMAKVQGPALQALFEHFRDMWHENVSRKARKFRFEGANMMSFEPGTPVLPARTLVTAPTGAKHHVQSVRTIPRFNYRWYNCLPENKPISYAPDGLFSYKLAWRKAIKAAESYIYIEDQAYWSIEILGWVNEALKAAPNLRVILLMQGGVDPNDPPLDTGALLTKSINHSLLDGLNGQLARVALYRAMGDTVPLRHTNGTQVKVDVVGVVDAGANALLATGVAADQDVPEDHWGRAAVRITPVADATKEYLVVGNPAIAKGSPVVWRVAKQGQPIPATGEYLLSRRQGLVLHPKTLIIDDHWAVIGSGNIMRRSIYTDIEHGVSFIDEDGAAVRDYRCELWADHFRHGAPADFANLDASLHAWNPAWGAAGGAPPRPPWIEPVAVPVAEVATSDELQERFDKYQDLDSREPWGGLTP